MSSSSYKSNRGFTIVELLIVIVVIAILAAISIVAYTGIQNNARASGRQQDASNIAKVAETIFADTSSYPTTVTSGKFTTTSTTSRLPDNVSLDTPLAANAVEPTTDTSPVENNGVKTYKWKACGASAGIEVYYWDPRDGGSIKTVTAGQGCAP